MLVVHQTKISIALEIDNAFARNEAIRTIDTHSVHATMNTPGVH